MAMDQDIRDVEKRGLSALLDWAFGTDESQPEPEATENSSSIAPPSTEDPT